MFKKRKSPGTTINPDVELLLQAIDGIIGGKYDDIDISGFVNPIYGQKLNDMLHAFKRSNNNYVMRLNDAMGSIGDNSYVKKTFDQVNSQAESIADMETASQNLEISIGHITENMAHIRDNTREMLSVVKNSTEHMNDSIKMVNESSERITNINEDVQRFQEKIDKIGNIVELVKEVASQSDLLALNASIEAARAGEVGRGFAIVAEQVRLLSNSTAELAENIATHVTELTRDIGTLATSMNNTTASLAEGNAKVEASLNDIEKMTEQMMTITEKIDTVFEDIDMQSNFTKSFTKQVSNISDSYEELVRDCTEQGTHIFKIGRYIDTARSDMARGISSLTQQDWLRVYEIDHFILMWRVYNHAMGFEQLKINQVNNFEGCKLGKWIVSQTKPEITGSSEFAALKRTHQEIHEWATKSWEAKEADNTELALEYFNQTYEAYFRYQDAIQGMMNLFTRLGDSEKTEIVVFQK